MKHNYAVILAGGVGSRFWPFSRELEPKQFMRISGDMTLLQDTIRRLNGIVAPGNIFIITNRQHFYELKKQVEGFFIPEANIILEPEGKNTAPAAGLCARLISMKDKDAVLVVLPSDHYVKGRAAFKKTLGRAIACAEKGYLATIGIRPRSPSTGYGYIKVNPGPNIKKKKFDYFSVEKFLEKPEISKAKRYFRDKSFFWNSGIFIWKASVFLNELRKHLPKLYSLLMSLDSLNELGRIWQKIIPISIDYGIMEHSGKIALVPANFYWTDLGSWDALREILPQDDNGNIIRADSLDLNSKGICVLSRGNRLISTIGLKDVIIADTPDALLVCDKSRAQEVKRVVELLKSGNRKERLVHATEKRPWGAYTVLDEAAGFKIKLIEIDPGKRLSLQRHKSRAEHWVVVSGTARVTSGGSARLIRSNESIFIPRGTKHRLENPRRSVLKIVEVQTGEYLEEDDIERFDDDFKR